MDSVEGWGRLYLRIYKGSNQDHQKCIPHAKNVGGFPIWVNIKWKLLGVKNFQWQGVAGGGAG